MLLLLGDPEILSERLELLNECFSYSDMLKPTMVDYATRELLDNFKFAATLNENHEDYDYILYLLTAIPHIITASETGKMISLGLLRAFIFELTSPGVESPIIMHIYRNVSRLNMNNCLYFCMKDFRSLANGKVCQSRDNTG